MGVSEPSETAQNKKMETLRKAKIQSHKCRKAWPRDSDRLTDRHSETEANMMLKGATSSSTHSSIPESLTPSTP